MSYPKEWKFVGYFGLGSEKEFECTTCGGGLIIDTRISDFPEKCYFCRNGIYPGGARHGVAGQYASLPIQKEAAREIVRLREEIQRLTK